MDRKEVRQGKFICLYIVAVVALTVLGLYLVKAADPVYPDDIDLIRNVTKNSSDPEFINISGGRIGEFSVNSTSQNPRWKAFVGNVTGKFTLDDPEGETVFDWTIASITGRIYATSNYSAMSWSNVNCSTTANMEAENQRFNHTNPDDNITSTFSAPEAGTHEQFYVAGREMVANDCPTLNTYNNSAAQDDVFEEVSLYDGNNMIYATILEDDEPGYNLNKYDFQMIVPENALSGTTAYYIYIELGN
jgi:hypothetical protein